MSLLRHLFGSNSNSWARILIVFAFAWAFLVYVFVTKLGSQPNIEPDVTSKRINQAIILLERTQQRNAELKQMVDDILNNQVDKEAAQRLIEKLEYSVDQNAANDILDAGGGGGGVGQEQEFHYNDAGNAVYGSPSNEPTLEYELQRRRIQTNIAETWNYFSNELGKIRNAIKADAPQLDLVDIDSVLQLAAEHKRSLLSDMENLRRLDGYEAWRYREAKDLSDLVQRRLHYLQNPVNCKTARKLVCKLNKGCGYGCQLHHLIYCFIVAYATERTMIIKSRGWRYHKGGWDEVFQPVSETCLEADIAHAGNWNSKPDVQVIILAIIDSIVPRPPYLPLAIPEDLAPRLKRLHGDPIVWWIGQFLKYLLKPQPGTQNLLNDGLKRMGFKKPIVGIHVRRTDKLGTEADFHSVSEYMTYVEDYYLTLEMNGTTVKRRVFIASDDALVLQEARRKFPAYEILGDDDVARLAAVSTRYTDNALNGIILDIHMLSLCDYLVCTFSSQVCRTAYEIMQTFHPDASHHFKSLDDIYYYGGQNPHNQIAVIDHKGRSHDELHMKKGDLVGIAGNHWNGFSKGTNRRTNQNGLYPSFKAIDKIETAKMPTYPQVK